LSDSPFFSQFDAQILYFNTFITFLYMFRALLCPSSGGQNCINTASGVVTLETGEWSKLLKYTVCCVIWTLADGEIHIKPCRYN